MKLYINTSDSQRITVGVNGKRFETDAKEGASQKLLSFIDEILKKEKASIKDITEIEVETGPGSFTGLRVGVSVANAIGWSLGILVNGKEVGGKESIDIKYS